MINVFDKYYKEYDQWYEENKFVYLSEIAAIRKVLPENAKGLEVGVGTGRFAAALNTHYGLDLSQNMLCIARERGINVVAASAQEIPFKSGVFDYITFIISICFINNYRKALEQAIRVLKPAGRVIIGFVDKDSFLGRAYKEKKSLFYEKANFFNVKEIGDLARNAGLSNIHYYQTLFALPRQIDSVEEPKEGFGQGGFVVVAGTKSTN
jgi:ubiquinone/menaquinone biosynthesis C-methylase UbiE